MQVNGNLGIQFHFYYLEAHHSWITSSKLLTVTAFALFINKKKKKWKQFFPLIASAFLSINHIKLTTQQTKKSKQK